jgi:DNA-binding response OmpR family regulator
MTAALLVAEPEPEVRGFLERQLSSDGFDVVATTAAGETLELAERARPDLVLVASELGGGAGLELCRRLREGEPGREWDRRVPVIVLGDADAIDRVRAFKRGCDDYVPRPFAYEELLARIRAVLRRAAPVARERSEVGELKIDRAARCVWVRGERISLSTKEYELVLRLASDPTRVFRKDELLREVWGYQSLGSTPMLPASGGRSRRSPRRHTCSTTGGWAIA